MYSPNGTYSLVQIERTQNFIVLENLPMKHSIHKLCNAEIANLQKGCRG